MCVLTSCGFHALQRPLALVVYVTVCARVIGCVCVCVFYELRFPRCAMYTRVGLCVLVCARVACVCVCV